MNESLKSALEALPHGESFRFVDEVVSLAPGKEAYGLYRVKGSEAFLEGHFPGQPIMPGVILVEAIAQLGGIAAQTDPKIPAMENLRLASIRSAKIFGVAVPGDVLELRATMEGRLGGLVQITGEVSGPHGLLANAKVALSGMVRD